MTSKPLASFRRLSERPALPAALIIVMLAVVNSVVVISFAAIRQAGSAQVSARLLPALPQEGRVWLNQQLMRRDNQPLLVEAWHPL